MNTTLKEILDSREDMSDYIFHFTKGNKALSVLQNIINDGAIKDINNNGYICFSEAPITFLPSMFEIFKKYRHPMFAPYGIGIGKDMFFKHGGRPVIYGDEEDYDLLNEKLKWRFVKLVPSVYDFSWLREWRINIREYKLDATNCIVITDTLEEQWNTTYEFKDIEIDVEPDDGGYTTFYYGEFERKYKCVSFEEINSLNEVNKNVLNQLLDQQECLEVVQRYLGCDWQ